jgi:hypothetical protein
LHENLLAKLKTIMISEVAHSVSTGAQQPFFDSEIQTMGEL